MKAIVGISLRLLRGGGKRDRKSILLAIIAYTVTTALLLVVLGGLHGFSKRAEDASAWKVSTVSDSVSDSDGTSGLPEIAANREPAGGKSMTVIDIVPGKNNPVPPGMSTSPNPGEVYVSPALANLMDSLPDSRLADRYSGPVKTLNPKSLPTSNTLLAVVGKKQLNHSAHDDYAWDVLAPTYFTGFAEPNASLAMGADDTASLGVDETAPLYLGLAWLAVLLMAVPLITLGGAAARLGVSRRNARLAALRLAGATPRQVVGMTVIESIVHAGIGAIAGACLSFALLPIVGLIPFQGTGFAMADLWIGLLPMMGVLAGIVILAGVSAAIGLRRVVVSPLGVANRTTPPRVTWVRAAVFAAAIIGWNFLAQSPVHLGASVVLVALACVFGVVNLIGPWLITMLARLRAGRANKATDLLAARRLLDDPKSAWRSVSGLALASFVAAIVCVMPAMTSGLQDRPTTLSVTAQSEPAAKQLEITVHHRLDDAGVAAKISHENSNLRVTLESDSPAAEDKASTILSETAPGPVTSSEARQQSQATLLPDIRTGVLLTLLITFVIAAASVGIAQAASTLDRRRLYQLMRLAGTERRTLDTVRFKTTLWPLLLTCIVSAGLGLLFTFPLLGGMIARPSGILLLFGTLIGGIVLVLAASAASRPILNEVLRDDPASLPS